MRVVAGTLRGRRLVAPAGVSTRPTSDRVREAVFSILGDVIDADVLDLFAGSGAMAVEALSRGARSATCVDSDLGARTAIRANAALLDEPATLTIVGGDWRGALRRLARQEKMFQLCLIDPPYSLLPRIAGELGVLLAPVLSPGARLVIESAAADGPPQLEVQGMTTGHRTDRTYGSTAITILHLDAIQ